MPPVSILSALRERAARTPDEDAFTFTDYDDGPRGPQAGRVVETLTWSQLHRRTLNLAEEIGRHGCPGDRALILAPQGLPYVVAFLAAMRAGLIAVPLALPTSGTVDERISAVVADTAPTVVLTTAAVADTAAQHVDDGAAMVAVIAVDTLDLDTPHPDITDPSDAGDTDGPAYLQYTSGSTRLPAGVMISHRNLRANFDQLMADFFAGHGGTLPAGAALVSWLPFYHDMGLMLGIAVPVLGGGRAELMSPLAFLTRPARWLHAMSGNTCWSAAPNFAFDLAVRRTTDADLAGVDLSRVIGISNGAERIHPATLARFAERFGPVGFRPEMMVPSYGLAEATVYVASGSAGRAPGVVGFDADRLAVGVAERHPGGTPLVRYGLPASPLLRIVDPDTHRVCPDGVVGEIWTRGDNVSHGYWGKPERTGAAFGATLADPPAGTPATDWLRTGDRGFVSAGELFIVGRIKDMLIVRGRNHYSEDIETTVQQITHGRVAAIAVPDGQNEKLITIVELKDPDGFDALAMVKSDVTAAISRAHGLQVGEIVLVRPGSIPTTTSGKIRRSACAEQHRQGRFVPLDS